MATTADEDLMATSDAILSDAERLRALELAKRGLTADDPRVAELAGEIAGLAGRLKRLTVAEETIAQEAQERQA